MGLRILQERVVWWPVTVNLAVDGGKTEEQKGELRFRVPDGATSFATDSLADLVSDWRGDAFVSETGEACPFSKDELKRALDTSPAFREAVLAAILQAARGAPAKN